jgi:AhpD family alkylhydroperoxidase
MHINNQEGADMDQRFDRKIFTFKILIEDLWYLLTHVLQVRGILRDKVINKSFIEKIMTVVTAVNGCTYCSWYHAKQALASGLSEDEIKNMLSLQFEADASDFELMALLYAQHYAETNRNPDVEMTNKLIDTYGEITSQHVLLIIRMIFFGNLLGNTVDAFLSRINGIPADNSNVIFEVFFFIITAPLLFPAKWMMKADAKASY